MANEMANEIPVRNSSSTRNKLIILGVLLLVLILVTVAISRKVGQTSQQISGTSFTLMTTIYDLRTPLGVAVDGEENIYVADTGNVKLRFYDPSGVERFSINQAVEPKDESKTYEFGTLYGMAVDDARNKVYVCDTVVYVFDKAGNFQYFLKPPEGTVTTKPGEGSPRPNEVALYKDKVYVTSRDGIYIFSAEDGKFIDHWGKRGAEVGNYDFPNGIAIDQTNGNIYVVDTNNWRVVALTPDGKPRWTLGNQDDGKVSSPFHLPRSIAVGPDGRLYVSDVPDRIIVLDSDGNLVATIGDRGTEDAQLNFPEGIAITASNKMVFADRENNRVQVWQLSDPLPTPSTADVDKFKKALRKV